MAGLQEEVFVDEAANFRREVKKLWLWRQAWNISDHVCLLRAQNPGVGIDIRLTITLRDWPCRNETVEYGISVAIVL